MGGPEVVMYMCLISLTVLEIAAAEVCTEVYRYGSKERTRTFHCSFGCCGPDYDQYCCVSHAGVIVGIVFACIFGIAFLSACVCCFLKHKAARARMVRPSGGTVVDGSSTEHTTTHTNVFIVPNGTGPPAYSATYYNPYFRGPEVPPGGVPSAYPMMPPAYDAASVPPPAYSYTSQPPPPGYSDLGKAQASGSPNGSS